MKEKDLKKIQRECETIYSTFGACPNHSDVVYSQIEPKHFSFNSPFGACPNCLGIGEVIDFDENLIIPDKNLCIADGAISMWKHRAELTWQIRGLTELFKKYKFDVFTKIKDLNKEQYEALLFGDDEIKRQKLWSNYGDRAVYEGIIPMYRRLLRQTDSDKRKEHFEKFMRGKKCLKCNGRRLKDEILSIKIDNKSIMDLCDMNCENALNFVKNLPKKLNEKQNFIAKQVLKELNDRLSFLTNVGLNYLTLNRKSQTLSGGESQRIRLASQIGANLTGVLYVLDEPSIGLHQKDNEKLIQTLTNLRDIGNTLVVVEHDEDTILSADYIVDIGEGAGVKGGHIVFNGNLDELKKSDKSLTGKYIFKKKEIEVPKKRREINF